MSNGTLNGELVSYTEQQTKGEVDTQIVTAKRYPRSIKQFKERALSLATLDEDTASGCFYTLPARKGGNNKPIEGPSARLAEIVAGSWGNIRAQATIVNDDGEFLTAKGCCWDLENNVAISVDVRRRITDRNNNRFSADMINTTANAACSIALRNSVFKIVPMALVKPIYEAARLVAVGDTSTLVKRRADAIAHFQKMGVKPEQVLRTLEKASIEDITVDDIALLKGLSTAIKDGDTTIDEAFPIEKPATKDQEPKTASDALADSLAHQSAAKVPTVTTDQYMKLIEVATLKECDKFSKELIAMETHGPLTVDECIQLREMIEARRDELKQS